MTRICNARFLGRVAYAEAAQLHIRANMAQPKAGRTYKRKSVVHQASAPGEAPAIDTTHLVESIAVRHWRRMTWSVGTPAEYAPGLEYGTVKMAARPSFRPALDHIRKPLMSEVARVARP